ncbi:MAG TPA: SRPBCC family protein [Nocardioidaceae bacterium]|nr:SRPBCC family protein [Nocardioidaceae bacterium]
MTTEPVSMMPAEKYTSPDVLAWERRNLFAGTWTCLGRVDDLFPSTTVTQRALMIGDIQCLVVRSDAGLAMFANTCRHRGHELLPEGSTSERRSILCPYHAWTYDFGGSLIGAKGFREVEDFEFEEHGLVELPVRVWEGWVFGHALHSVDSSAAPSFDEHLGALGSIVAPYAPAELVLADRHTYEVAANWKVIAENYHECYHCPLIHPELCQVSPPDSGDNYDLPGAWVGGSMDLRDGVQTMSLDGSLVAPVLPGVSRTHVEYVHLLPNLLISAHPDYVMTHRLVPLDPGRTWVECSWLMAPGAPDPAPAVQFWDLTNKQDWAACESVQRGLSSPHFQPGPFAPNEDAVAQLVSMIGRAYETGRLT